MLGLLFWNKKEEESGKRFSFVCLLFLSARDGVGKTVGCSPGWYGGHQQKNVLVIAI